MATTTLPATSATEHFIDAIAAAWEFFKTVGQLREAFDSLSSSARSMLPLIVCERRALEALRATGAPTYKFRLLADQPDKLAIQSKKLVEIRSELAHMGAFSERDLKVFDELAAEVSGLHKLYTAVVRADRSVAPPEFWEQAEEAVIGSFEDGGEFLARLQGGSEI
jgi:hypothetical protein